MKLNAKQLAELIAAALAPVFTTILGETKAAASDDGDDDGETVTPIKRGRGRPKKEAAKTTTKSKSKAKPADEEEEEEEDDDAGLGDDNDDDDDDLGLGEEDEDVTQEDVVNAFKTLKASKGIDKCREVLGKLGESNVLNIPPKKYADALKEINRAASKK
jgi:hypothetical protein